MRCMSRLRDVRVSVRVHTSSVTSDHDHAFRVGAIRFGAIRFGAIRFGAIPYLSWRDIFFFHRYVPVMIGA